MIGVIADVTERAAAAEFFELFKTPWEFYRADHRYDVLLCAGHEVPGEAACGIVIVYSGQRLPCDAGSELEAFEPNREGRMLAVTAELSPEWSSHACERVPVYGHSLTFCARKGSRFLRDVSSRRAAGYLSRTEGPAFARIGYDLFREVRILLSAGQPVQNAAIPALDLHIAILREVIATSGLSIAEIPPVPEGYRFVACLTHDVDHPSIRLHRCDRTILGFVYRATVGSLLKLARRRISVGQLVSNWTAALTLPLVQLGLAKDFWATFHQYSNWESGLPSSYFVIPFKGRRGRCEKAPAPRERASRYGVADIADGIRALTVAGNEIGLHGIDAWCDLPSAREEFQQIRMVSGLRPIGVRMHWLYFGRQSPAILEAAGAEYDSTAGYNETVGYRAGTAQPYKPLDVKHLLELPLIVMDTALFFPARLNLSSRQAKERVARIIDNAARYGGCVTVNWHDRSIAPERLWGDFYALTIQELKARGAWFATASEAVAWFRKRRSARFENVSADSGDISITGIDDGRAGLPGLQVVMNQGREPFERVAVCTGRARP